MNFTIAITLCTNKKMLHVITITEDGDITFLSIEFII